MFKFLMLFIYILFNIYILFRIIWWVHYCFKVTHRKIINTILITLYELFSITLFLGAFLPKSIVQFSLLKISNHYLGIFFYMLVFTIVGEIIFVFYYFINKEKEKAPSKRIIKAIGIIIALLSIIIPIYGIYHEKHVYQADFDVTINKEISDLKIALISDLHLNYTTELDSLRQMRDIINDNNVDLVVIAGDIINNDFDYVPDSDKLIKIFSSIKSTYGTYAVYGNHDVTELLVGGFSTNNIKHPMIDERLDKLLEDSNITLLKDDYVLINNEFYLVGRRDYEKPGNKEQKRMDLDVLMKNINDSYPIILLDHEPKFYNSYADAGIDLVLSGHTHAGQFFPLTVTRDFTSDNGYGLKKFDNMSSVVTSGIGTYGPAIRVGTNSEVAIVNVSSK